MSIHFIMQGQGVALQPQMLRICAVFASLTSSANKPHFPRIVAFFKALGAAPINLSLSKYKSLNVKTIDIMDGDEIDPGRFDQLIHHIAESPPEHQMVVDIGASCFVPLCSYMKQRHAFEVIQSLGFNSYIHTLISRS